MSGMQVEALALSANWGMAYGTQQTDPAQPLRWIKLHQAAQIRVSFVSFH